MSGLVASGSRTLWKGAITFGLVHIPVGLHTASIEQGVDFDWLDRRSMDPVGYRRINKKTGKEIARDDIVRGVEYEDGKYVVLSNEDIEAAYPRTTQTIEILRFVEAGEIPFVYLERPYYLAPARGKGARRRQDHRPDRTPGTQPQAGQATGEKGGAQESCEEDPQGRLRPAGRFCSDHRQVEDRRHGHCDVAPTRDFVTRQMVALQELVNNSRSFQTR